MRLESTTVPRDADSVLMSGTSAVMVTLCSEAPTSSANIDVQPVGDADFDALADGLLESLGR